MSFLSALGVAPVLSKKEEREQEETEARKRRAKRLMKKGLLSAAAEELVGSIDGTEENVNEANRETKPEEEKLSEPTEKASTPTDPEDTSEADDFISSFEETLSDEIKAMSEPETPFTEVTPQLKESNELPSIREAIAETDAVQSDDAVKAHARSIVAQKTQPIQEEEPMVNKNRSFYNEELGDAAYRFDGGIDKEPSPVLRDYVKSVIARDPAIIDEIVRDYLPDIIGKNPQMIPSIMKMIQEAEDKNIPIKAFYINVKDPESQEEYDTWEAATASIAKEINTYGVDPKEVFRTIWREVTPDGNLGNQLGQSEVVDYIENRYHGDKEKIKKLLRVKYTDKATGGKKPATAKSAKTGGKKKADNGAAGAV